MRIKDQVTDGFHRGINGFEDILCLASFVPLLGFLYDTGTDAYHYCNWNWNDNLSKWIWLGGDWDIVRHPDHCTKANEKITVTKH